MAHHTEVIPLGLVNALEELSELACYFYSFQSGLVKPVVYLSDEDTKLLFGGTTAAFPYVIEHQFCMFIYSHDVPPLINLINEEREALAEPLYGYELSLRLVVSPDITDGRELAKDGRGKPTHHPSLVVNGHAGAEVRGRDSVELVLVDYLGYSLLNSTHAPHTFVTGFTFFSAYATHAAVPPGLPSQRANM